MVATHFFISFLQRRGSGRDLFVVELISQALLCTGAALPLGQTLDAITSSSGIAQAVEILPEWFLLRRK